MGERAESKEEGGKGRGRRARSRDYSKTELDFEMPGFSGIHFRLGTMCPINFRRQEIDKNGV
jgi:hypothetical protein